MKDRNRIFFGSVMNNKFLYYDQSRFTLLVTYETDKVAFIFSICYKPINLTFNHHDVIGYVFCTNQNYF